MTAAIKGTAIRLNQCDRHVFFDSGDSCHLADRCTDSRIHASCNFIVHGTYPDLILE